MDFNRYATNYGKEVETAVSFAGQDHDFFTQVKALSLQQLLGSHFGENQRTRILDLGCGIGSMSRLLGSKSRRVFGVDVAAGALSRARREVPEAQFAVYDGNHLPFSDNQLDVVFAICVAHHVPPSAWPQFFREMSRVVRPGGILVIFEHNPFNPLTRLAVSRCEFDSDAVLLSPSRVKKLLQAAKMEILETKNILFFPWKGSLWRRVEDYLGAVPLGAQYFVAATKAEQ